jgi:hypothetical protein
MVSPARHHDSLYQNYGYDLAPRVAVPTMAVGASDGRYLLHLAGILDVGCPGIFQDPTTCVHMAGEERMLVRSFY